jgi:hypothetical protein
MAVAMPPDWPRPDGIPDARYLLFPKSEAASIDTWHVNGLRGTGSHHPTQRWLSTIAQAHAVDTML